MADKNKKPETKREALRREYLKGGWRDKAHKDSPAGRNRDAKKK